MKNIFNSAGCISLLLAFSSMTQAAHHPDPLLDAIKDPARNSAYAARDDSRNPYKIQNVQKDRKHDGSCRQ